MVIFFDDFLFFCWNLKCCLVIVWSVFVVWLLIIFFCFLSNVNKSLRLCWLLSCVYVWVILNWINGFLFCIMCDNYFLLFVGLIWIVICNVICCIWGWLWFWYWISFFIFLIGIMFSSVFLVELMIFCWLKICMVSIMVLISELLLCLFNWIKCRVLIIFVFIWLFLWVLRIILICYWIFGFLFCNVWSSCLLVINGVLMSFLVVDFWFW